jgi:hypothetical protein
MFGVRAIERQNNLKIFFVLFIFLLVMSSCQKSNITGIYRLSSSGGVGIILKLNDNSRLQYLNWVDVGGGWNGFDGEYYVNEDTLTTSIFYPVNDDTFYVRIDTLLIRNVDGIRFLVPTFMIDEFDESITNNLEATYWYKENKTDSLPLAGIDCFVKLRNQNLKDVTDDQIEWSKVTNLNGVRIRRPPPPPRPKPDTLIDESETELK